jgi:hypothetical protein
MLLALVLTLLVGAPVAAQAVLAEDRLRMPAGLGAAVGLVAADFDRDGLVDVARASADAVTILIQQPSGRFEVSPAQVPLIFAAPVVGLTVGSLQPAGSTLDLVVALRGAPPVVLWNVGPGTFVRAPINLPTAPQPVAVVAVFDFDLRPPDDILVLPEQGRPQLLLAQSGGGYRDASAVLGATLFLQSPCVAVVDLDGDTDLDLVFASAALAPPFVLENNGTSVPHRDATDSRGVHGGGSKRLRWRWPSRPRARALRARAHRGRVSAEPCDGLRELLASRPVRAN